MLRYGIEIEFVAADISLLLQNLYSRGIDFKFFDKLDRHKILSDKTKLVIKPDESLGPHGWEINIPPDTDWDQIAEILDIVKRSGAEITEKAALHIHVDTYYLSKFDIDNIYRYYYYNQEFIVFAAAANNLYLDLNAPLPENPKDIKTRKTRLNFKALQKHKTIEHRIYKSSLDLIDIKFAVNQTLNIIKKGGQLRWQITQNN